MNVGGQKNLWDLRSTVRVGSSCEVLKPYSGLGRKATTEDWIHFNETARFPINELFFKRGFPQNIFKLHLWSSIIANMGMLIIRVHVDSLVISKNGYKRCQMIHNQ